MTFNLTNEFLHPEDLIIFAQATKGNVKAIVTFYNAQTSDHRTYRFARGKTENCPVFVNMLFGSDPENKKHYAFIGTIFEDNTFRYSKKSRFEADAAGVKGFEWVWNRVTGAKPGGLPKKVKLLHAGRCGRCGRTLTAGDSLYKRKGIGPDCAEILGLT